MLTDILLFVAGLIVGWFFLPSPLWASSMMANLAKRWPWLSPYTTATTPAAPPAAGGVTPVPEGTVTQTSPMPTSRTLP